MADSHFGSLVLDDTGGTGQAIVMLHGLGGTSNSFEPLMPGLDEFRVVRPDLPGAGRSTLRPGIHSIPELARSVTNALTAIKVSRAIIVAHSMGTLLAQHMAISAPHRVDGLLLFGALTEPSTTARQALQARARSAIQDGMGDIASAVAAGGLSSNTQSENPAVHAFVRESLMRQNPAGYAAHCKILAASKAYPCRKIKIPVHLVTGSQDKVAPRAMAEELNTVLPFSRLEVLSGVGHWPVIEAPVASRRAMHDALDAFCNPDVIERNLTDG